MVVSPALDKKTVNFSTNFSNKLESYHLIAMTHLIVRRKKIQFWWTETVISFITERKKKSSSTTKCISLI